MKLINQNRQDLFPVIISALYKNSKQHWNRPHLLASIE